MLVILDRDGVINQDSDDYVKSTAEWFPIPGSLEAIARLNQLGHTVVIATNQSGIGRGLYSEADLRAIHDTMSQQLQIQNGHIDGIFYCPHHPDADCNCRKPKPGLLLQIAQQFNADLTQALLIGDALRDIQCAHAVGCRAILVKTGKGTQTLLKHREILDVPVFEDLRAVVEAYFNL